MSEEEEFDFYVGIDWGNNEHQVCGLDRQGRKIREGAVAHTGEAIAAFAAELVMLADGQPGRVAVAIERPDGAVVETLLDRGVTVFAINPKQLDRFRDRFSVAGAKDDRRDAFVLASSLRTDGAVFRRLRVEPGELRELRELLRIHDELRDDLNGLGNRLLGLLLCYFAQVVALDSIHTARWLWELLLIAPTPAEAARLSRARLASILKRHHIRRIDAIELQTALRAPPLVVAPGVTEACSRHVNLLIARLKLADEQQRACTQRIELALDELCAEQATQKEHRDVAIIRSWPGLGPISTATMLTAAAELLAARDYHRLRLLAGTAPVTRQTGVQNKGGRRAPVSMRRACNHRLRRAVRDWAVNSISRDARSKALYSELRRRGHGFERALRGVADRLLGALCASLRTGTMYDQARRTIANSEPAQECIRSPEPPPEASVCPSPARSSGGRAQRSATEQPEPPGAARSGERERARARRSRRGRDVARSEQGRNLPLRDGQSEATP